MQFLKFTQIFPILFKRLSSLDAYLQIFEMCLSNLSLKSVFTPNSLTSSSHDIIQSFTLKAMSLVLVFLPISMA